MRMERKLSKNRGNSTEPVPFFFQKRERSDNPATFISLKPVFCFAQRSFTFHQNGWEFQLTIEYNRLKQSFAVNELKKIDIGCTYDNAEDKTKIIHTFRIPRPKLNEAKDILIEDNQSNRKMIEEAFAEYNGDRQWMEMKM